MVRAATRRKSDPDKPRTGSQIPPKDSPAGRRPLTEDEKVDEAVEESMGTSDPPGYGGAGRVGAPPKRKTQKKKNNPS
jgi:hypothetical protein